MASYFDDLITMNCSYSACSKNIMKIIKLMSPFGLIVHPSKSILFPCQEIEYLGFIINSTNVTLTLTPVKRQKILVLCDEILSSAYVKIMKVLQLLGKFSSSFITVPQGKLYYRSLEINKTSALKINKGNFDKFMILSKESKANINWWKNNIMDSFAPIPRPNPSIVLNTDTSLVGWGASIAGSKTGVLFSMEESQQHINILELKAVLFGLKALCNKFHNIHILIQIGNTMAVAAINKRG